MDTSSNFVARRYDGDVFHLVDYGFLFHKETLHILGVMVNSDDSYNLRQLTSTEKLIADSFGLKY